MSGRSAMRAKTACGRRRQRAHFTMRVLNNRFRAAAKANRATNYRTLKRMYGRLGAFRKALRRHWSKLSVSGQLRGQKTYDRMVTAMRTFVHKVNRVRQTARRCIEPARWL